MDRGLNGTEGFPKSGGYEGYFVDDEYSGRRQMGHMQISDKMPEASVCVYLYICRTRTNPCKKI
jgi:hypothetical protein